MKRQYMTIIDKWPLFRGYNALFNQGRVTDVWPLFTGWSLFRGDLYTGLTYIKIRGH